MNQRNAQKYKPSLHDFSVVDKYMKTVCITLNTISAVYGLLTFVLTHGTPRANSKLPSPKTKMQNSLNNLDIHPF